MPDRMPERMPDRMSEYMPERMSDRMSEYASILLDTPRCYVRNHARIDRIMCQDGDHSKKVILSFVTAFELFYTSQGFQVSNFFYYRQQPNKTNGQHV